ncbi:hypothetical protein SADUNF_Sadunf13G0068000 [Salix dunnii]|uniref:Uncharacterized protein n=1 Tax=Salix dunnii TaxID=1413687 RepID=A0A835MNE1_9ROSI|nr:hypothetical protein SADUNF_Sadunf13G0068000 [Salix dunnii]
MRLFTTSLLIIQQQYYRTKLFIILSQCCVYHCSTLLSLSFEHSGSIYVNAFQGRMGLAVNLAQARKKATSGLNSLQKDEESVKISTKDFSRDLFQINGMAIKIASKEIGIPASPSFHYERHPLSNQKIGLLVQVSAVPIGHSYKKTKVEQLPFVQDMIQELKLAFWSPPPEKKEINKTDSSDQTVAQNNLISSAFQVAFKIFNSMSPVLRRDYFSLMESIIQGENGRINRLLKPSCRKYQQGFSVGHLGATALLLFPTNSPIPSTTGIQSKVSSSVTKQFHKLKPAKSIMKAIIIIYESN